MSLSVSDWHQRFLQQARWTRELRRYLYGRAGLYRANRVLEVGCGTGALLTDLIHLEEDVATNQLKQAHSPTHIHGLDLDPGYLAFAACHVPQTCLTIGDALNLPYAKNSFELTLCHFLLLWVNDPRRVVVEMARVTRSGGAVLALAEPDYGGRIDYPPALTQLGAWQQTALRRQGAEPHIGRRLAALFHTAGLADVETGVLGGQWKGVPSEQELEGEWAVLRSDLEETISSETLNQMHALEKTAWSRGERVLYVPTFYAWGRVHN